MLHYAAAIAAVAALLALGGCDGGQPEPVPRVNALPADTAAVRVGGPTLIAFVPAVTERQLREDDALNTTLDDFGWYIASASDTLRALGFAIVGRTGDSVRVIVRGREFTFLPAPDSGRVGYLLVAPDRGPFVHYGVHTDAELISLARRYVAPDSGR